MAKTEPQCAVPGLTKSLQAEWNFSHRNLGGSSQLFQPLENLLMEKFYLRYLERRRFHQWRDVSFVCQQEKVVLVCLTQPVSPMSLTTRHGKKLRFFMMLLLISTVFHEDHKKQMSRSRKKHHRRMEEKHEELLGELLNELPADQVRAVKRINEGSLSAWLTALTIAAENFDLSEVEFRDALSVRYNKNLIASPTLCDGCQSPFTLRHALVRKKGGLLTLRHNEIRDAT